MTGEVKMSAWDLAAGQHVRLVFAPGASLCGTVLEATERFVRLHPCHTYPGWFWVRIPRRDLIAVYKQLELGRCQPWQLAFTGQRAVPSFM